MSDLAHGSLGVSAPARHRSTAAEMRSVRTTARRFGPVRRTVIGSAAGIGASLAIAALIGWWLGVPALRGLGGSRFQMNPVTALGHLTLAGIVWWWGLSDRPGPVQRVARVAGAALVLVGAYQTLALLTGWVPRLDLFMFRGQVLDAVVRGGAGVSIETSTSFALLGLGLVLVGKGLGSLRGVAPWEVPVLLGCLVAFFSLVRYAYASFPWSVEVAAYFPMAPNTALAFLAASIALLATLPGGVVAARFGGSSVSSTALRRLMAGTVVALTVGGALRVEAERRGIMGATFGTSLLATVGVLVAGLLLWRQTARLEEAEVDLRSLLAARQASETIARALFDLAPEGLLLVDDEGRIRRGNEEMETLTGYRLDELVGRTVESLVPERWRQHHAAHRRGFMEKPARRAMGNRGELGVLRKDGEEVAVEIALAPLEQFGDPQVIVAFKDVTHRQAMRRDLEDRARLLEDTNRELKAFSYSVSHDLRAPLRGIHGFCQILVEDYGDSLPREAQRYLGVVQESSVKMGLLIDNLLDFARLGQAPLRRRRVCLSELVRASFQECLSSSAGAGAGTEQGTEPPRKAELEVGALPECQADPALLKQAVFNLISNAVKFSRDVERPVVEVGCTEDETGTPVYFVRDNGVGFDPRYADKLFGVFQRLHRDEEFEGTGVGLALAQRVIHRHHGRIWAESEPGKGATFYFTLGAGEVRS